MGQEKYWERARAAWDGRARSDVEGYTSSTGSAEEHEKRGLQDAENLLQMFPADGARWGTGLEIGCGDGRLLQHFARRFERIHGCDVSREMVERARKRVPAATLHLLTSEELPATGLDAVYSFAVFQHMPREVFRRYVSSVARALSPGGLFVFHLKRPYTLRRRLKAMFGGEKVRDDTWNIRYTTWRRLRRWAREEGFQVLSEREAELEQFAAWKKP